MATQSFNVSFKLNGVSTALQALDTLFNVFFDSDECEYWEEDDAVRAEFKEYDFGVNTYPLQQVQAVLHMLNADKHMPELVEVLQALKRSQCYDGLYVGFNLAGYQRDVAVWGLSANQVLHVAKAMGKLTVDVDLNKLDYDGARASYCFTLRNDYSKQHLVSELDFDAMLEDVLTDMQDALATAQEEQQNSNKRAFVERLQDHAFALAKQGTLTVKDLTNALKSYSNASTDLETLLTVEVQTKTGKRHSKSFFELTPSTKVELMNLDMSKSKPVLTVKLM